ncbi:MAG: DUF447 domain-containing protein [Candidatus Geothermarchaeales archaeon]
MSSPLNRLGLLEGHIYETVVSTYRDDGEPHAAPMGIVLGEPGELIIRPFKTTLTCANLLRSRCGVANVTSDPEIFYRTAFKEANPGGRVPPEWFEAAEEVEAPRLKSADAHIAFVVTQVEEESGDRARVTCKIMGVEMERVFPRPYCRGVFATIECIIHATRIREYLSRGWVEDAEELLRLMSHYRSLCERVAPNSRYTSILSELDEYIKAWKQSGGVS